MFELDIKSESKVSRGKYVAAAGEEIVAQIDATVHRLYTVTFASGKVIEFRQLKGFTIDHLTFEIYDDGKLLGTLKRRMVKGSYEVNIYDVEIGDHNPFTIKEGWVSRGVTRYTNVEGKYIAIEKGYTGLFDWKVMSEDQILPLDIALILLMRAMSGMVMP